ncbi:RBPJ-interacting and tubulin-associated protein 1-like [Lingula anatina]|uniref:RBPJ-interacting and tubulin-associated protein 1 n=1 Tax=Lingula anatina TaxID=7574 RepID=A0A1S3HLD6_LINAN|nr:RBPJ-interacting and tubulin-associated protein 1-like [Lingula anatina]|eukprot:XP_013386920.1 RBPJ-interacting and tubulin-associated protein 1-like [Lingula anatina]
MNTSDHAFAIVGSRPSSSLSSGPPSGRSRNPYHKVSNTSEVDDLLFKPHNPNPRGDTQWSDRDNPFADRKEKPLIWSPPPSQRDSPSPQRSARSVSPAGSRSSTPLGSRSRNKYRLVKHTPTYVDEMLFGEPLPEPTFPAPWEKESPKVKPLLFSPTNYKIMKADSSKSDTGSPKRPLSGRPLSGRQGSAGATTTASRPAWR